MTVLTDVDENHWRRFFFKSAAKDLQRPRLQQVKLRIKYSCLLDGQCCAKGQWRYCTSGFLSNRLRRWDWLLDLEELSRHQEDIICCKHIAKWRTAVYKCPSRDCWQHGSHVRRIHTNRKPSTIEEGRRSPVPGAAAGARERQMYRSWLRRSRRWG
jgi:hypothetical protein